jgi:hypothetical protein
MKRLFFSLIFLICGLFGPQISFAQSGMKEILIVIGYADDNHVGGIKGVLSHRYYFGMAKSAEMDIVEFLTLNDFVSDPQNASRWIQARQNRAVTLLSANLQCPKEDTQQTVRSFVCGEQLQRSELLKDNLEKNIGQFDEFIYLGHSRLGQGLGLGPFFGDRFTFKPLFFNSVEAGRLKKIVIASCDSESYYKEAISRRTSIEFVGTKGAKLWIRDLLPLVLKELAFPSR